MQKKPTQSTDIVFERLESANGEKSWSARIPPKLIRRVVITALVLVVVLQVSEWTFSRLKGLLFLIFVSWLASLALEPVVAALQRRGIKRGLGTLISLLGLVVFALIFAAAFGQLLISQLTDLILGLPDVFDTIAEGLNSLFNLGLTSEQIAEYLSLSSEQIPALATRVAGGLFGVVISTVGIVFSFFTALLFTFYFTAEAPQIRAKVASWLSTEKQKIFLNVWSTASAKTGGFVISRLIMAIVSAVASSVFFLIISLPYWLPLGIFTGLVSQFIPTVGTYIGGAIPALIGLSESVVTALLVIGFVVVYQQIENYLIQPRISAKTMDVHPAVAFAAVIIGALLFGPIGALIGIPVAAAIVSLIDTYVHRYEISPELSNQT
jgi:predicted PurR-regulated permease PerM